MKQIPITDEMRAVIAPQYITFSRWFGGDEYAYHNLHHEIEAARADAENILRILVHIEVLIVDLRNGNVMEAWGK